MQLFSVQIEKNMPQLHPEIFYNFLYFILKKFAR
jgi:hypothetical protein